MFRNCRIGSVAALLIVLAAVGGCQAAPAPKVQCESNLRPINPSSLEHPQP
jgi:hypothetical protein